MLRFIARRILELVPVLFIIATVTFFMVRMAPGGPFDSEKNTTPEIRKAIEAYYGLDKPLFQQYLNVINGYLKGDLGPDYKYPNRSVQELILGAFPVSLELGCLARARVLPAMTLGFFYAAYVARLTRGGLLEILSQDFIRTARAKGASTAQILFKHALRGGIAPVVSFLGPAAAGIITGSFVVESIFDIPGLGRFFITAAFNRDYTLVLGTVLFYATLIVFFNLAVDIVQVWLNPKLKLE